MIKLYNGDCLEVMKNLPDKSVDLILCDLPYGTTACSWDVVIPFDKLWEQYNRVIRDTGIVILFGSQPFTSQLIMSNVEDFRYEIIWEKNNCSNFQLAGKNPLKFHENIVVFYKDILQTTFSDIIKENMKRLNLTRNEVSSLCLSKNGNKTGWLSNKIKGTQIPTSEQWEKLCRLFNISNEYETLLLKLKTHVFNEDTTLCNETHSNKNKSGKLGHLSSKNKDYFQSSANHSRSIIKYNKCNTTYHPTQKPVELLEYLIKTYTNEGMTVLDNCMGSGSTGVACINTNRNFIGIELDKKYFNTSVNRCKETLPLFKQGDLTIYD